MVVYVVFLCDVACQKLLYSANVSRSYSQNNTGTVFLRHGVDGSNNVRLCQKESDNQRQSALQGRELDR